MIELTKRAHIEAYIANNFEVLEELLNDSAKQYLALKGRKFESGEQLTPDNLGNLVREVLPKVKNYLQVEKGPRVGFTCFHWPSDLKTSAKIAVGAAVAHLLVTSINGFELENIPYSLLMGLLFGVGAFCYAGREHVGSAYDKGDRIVKIGDRSTVPAVASIAHEYVHCMQQQLTQLLRQWGNPIAEGHARSVQLAVAQEYADKHDNPGYIQDTVESKTRELKGAYLMACQKSMKTPRESLAKLDIPDYGFIGKFLSRHYCLGTAAMSIAQLKHGDKVNRDVLKNDYEFLRT